MSMSGGSLRSFVRKRSNMRLHAFDLLFQALEQVIGVVATLALLEVAAKRCRGAQPGERTIRAEDALDALQSGLQVLLLRVTPGSQALITDGVQRVVDFVQGDAGGSRKDRKSTRLNSSHLGISYAVFCL